MGRLAPMTQRNQIRDGAKWLLTGTLGSQIVQFAFNVALSRLLLPADFGMMVTMQIFTGLAGFFAGAGMGQALVQAKEVREDDYNVVFTIQILIGIGIYLIFFTAAPWFAVWFKNDVYRNLLRVSALTFLLRPFGSIPASRLQRAMRFKETSVLEVVTMLVTGVICIGMALLKMGPWSLVLAGIAGALLRVLMLLYITRWIPLIRVDREVARRLGAYGFKATANSIVEHFRTQTDNFIVSRMLGAGILGTYNKGYSLSVMPITITSGATYKVVFRALSKEQGNLDKCKYLYLRAITLMSVYTVPFYVGLWWLAEPFMRVVYGEKWLAAAPVLRILALSGLFRCVANASGAVAEAMNRLGHELRIQLESWAVVIAGCLVGVRWGETGVAWAMLLGFVYISVRISWLACHCIGVRFAEVLAALRPALVLNAIMIVVLSLGNLALDGAARSGNALWYLVSMAALGVLSYAGAFLYLPIEELLAEALRWKSKLRLA